MHAAALEICNWDKPPSLSSQAESHMAKVYESTA